MYLGHNIDFLRYAHTMAGRYHDAKRAADQLVAMRIHGVSPEFISEMKSRGMKDLTIDKLVSLRIHGID